MEPNEEGCVCSRCGIYNSCAEEKGELYFCQKGKSDGCISGDAWCICRTCTVYEKKGFAGLDYCLDGSEQELKK